MVEVLDDAEGGRGRPHALAGHRVVRGVIAAYHLAAVRARVHHPRGLQVLLDEVDQVRRVEGPVVADEDHALVTGRRQRRRRPLVVDADHGLARLTRPGSRHLAGDLRRGGRHGAGNLADRGLVQRELADAGGLPQDVRRARRGAARGGGRGAGGRRAAGRAAPALGQVDDQIHDRRHADHGRGQVQDHPRRAGALRGARARAGPGPAPRGGEVVVAEPGRRRCIEALLRVVGLTVAFWPVSVLAVAILVIAILLVGVLAVARLAAVPRRGGLLRGEAVLPRAVLGEAVLAEATVTEGVLLVVGRFGALLRERLGLVVRPGPARAT